MSFSVDVNVLLYASDRSSPLGERAAAFLEDCASGSDIFGLAWTTATSFVRIATHPSIFAHPLTPAEATGNVEALVRLPHVRMLAEEEGFLEVYREVTASMQVRGNLVPDAHLAALLRQHGVTRLYTNDRDYRKFDFLDIRNPFETRG